MLNLFTSFFSRYDGVGGNGGNVFFIPRHDLSFSDFPKQLSSMKIIASSGMGSIKTKLIGDFGPATEISVPLGIEVVREDTAELIARCERPHHRYLIARGGRGGCRANNFKAERGESVLASVHVKLRPNVAFLGLPNAGKSTLLKSLVPAKSVKIANYAFTTIHPQVAFWTDKDNEQEPDESPFTLSLADLPGIIEGASQNRGRGYSFLKHLEYADIVVVVVDCNGFQLKNDLSEPFRDVLECVGIVNSEVEHYNKKLASKPVVVVINKMDICRDPLVVHEVSQQLSSQGWHNSLPDTIRPSTPFSIRHVVKCSAKLGEIDSLRNVLKTMKNIIRLDNRVTN